MFDETLLVDIIFNLYLDIRVFFNVYFVNIHECTSINLLRGQPGLRMFIYRGQSARTCRELTSVTCREQISHPPGAMAEEQTMEGKTRYLSITVSLIEQ